VKRWLVAGLIAALAALLAYGLSAAWASAADHASPDGHQTASVTVLRHRIHPRPAVTTTAPAPAPVPEGSASQVQPSPVPSVVMPGTPMATAPSTPPAQVTSPAPQTTPTTPDILPINQPKHW